MVNAAVEPVNDNLRLVWILSGLVEATKLSIYVKSVSIYWEYVGGLMILFGLVRLL